jgi:predicted enzyme involved in methoxymalonyl-ACP biosynthesis
MDRRLEVHWESKAASLQRLSERLDLPLHAFVFLDDSPAELRHVSQALPDVLCVGIPGGRPADMECFVRRHWALDVWKSERSTAEDNLRTQTYRENAQRKVAQRAARHLPVSAFLRLLQLRVAIGAKGGERARLRRDKRVLAVLSDHAHVGDLRVALRVHQLLIWVLGDVGDHKSLLILHDVRRGPRV